MNEFVFVDVHGKDYSIRDGGAARALAWRRWISHNIDSSKVLFLNNSKGRIIKHFLFLLTSKRRTVFYIHPEYGFDIFKDDIIRRVIGAIFFVIFRFFKKRNNVIIDVSDMKFEQAIDLDLKKYSLKRIEFIEKKIFELDVNYVFASESMRVFACQKYNIPENKTSTAFNGGELIIDTDNEVDYEFDDDVIYFVYSGTLNRGRSIKKMIDQFPERQDIKLILMGTDGEWIKGLKRTNLDYLGAKEEKDAHKIVAKCDVGLIPYDDSRLYYNLAYPTKLSFYITAGIPILSTPVDEVTRVNKKNEICWCYKLDDWEKCILDISKKDIYSRKEQIDKIKRNYTWDIIFQNNELMKTLI